MREKKIDFKERTILQYPMTNQTLPISIGVVLEYNGILTKMHALEKKEPLALMKNCDTYIQNSL